MSYKNKNRVTEKDIELLLLVYKHTVINAGWISMRELARDAGISVGMVHRRLTRGREAHGWYSDTSQTKQLSLTPHGLTVAKKHAEDIRNGDSEVREEIIRKLRRFPRQTS